MSEITGTAVAHEAYAFCCMRCGHGWEQAYDIEHHVDGSGHNFVVYKSEGVRVPSPLSSPNCANCGGHVVRIMRSGQVSSVRALMAEQHHPAKTRRAAAAEEIPAQAGEEIPAGAAPSGEDGASAAKGAGAGADKAARHHHWHLSDLLHPFQHHQHRG
ncbi:hypothetical protein [Streptomyces sp. NPDC055036]